MKKVLFSDKIIVALDVGTTKISVLVARVIPPGQIEILGIGKSPSYGLEKGIVVDVAQAVASIKNAIQEAEIMAACTIESAYVGVSGAHIQSQKSEGMIPLKQGEVQSQDIAQVLASARAVSVPKGQQILHVLPHSFIIDGVQRVRDPLGLCGIRLEAQVHIITGSISLVNNLIKCCNMAGINVEDIVLEQLASAYAVLNEDERHLGVTVIDIGGGTADIALYQKGSVLFTHVIPVAGTNFTQDLAIGLQTTLKEAERVKLNYGTIAEPTIMETIEILRADGISSQTITQQTIASILRPRAQELLDLVAHHIMQNHAIISMPSGVVLTGGGALLDGLIPLAQEVFGTSARLGIPYINQAFHTSLSHPSHATAYGLLLYALRNNSTPNKQLNGPAIARIFSRMRSWITDFL